MYTIPVDWEVIADRFNKLSNTDYSFEGSSCEDRGFLEVTIDFVVTSKKDGIVKERYSNSGGNRFYSNVTEEKTLSGFHGNTSHPTSYNKDSITICKFHLLGITSDYIYPYFKNHEDYKCYF